MPTGYTAGVADGTVKDFKTYAYGCARAFGALIMMRDDPADALIPEAFEPSTWNADRLAEAHATVAKLSAMTDEEKQAAAHADYLAAVERFNERRAKESATRTRYEQMTAATQAWNPPTPNHQGLKEFMLQQLHESVRFDCDGLDEAAPTEITATAWHVSRLTKAYQDIAYHAKADAEEVARVNGRNEWLRAFRASVETPPASV